MVQANEIKLVEARSGANLPTLLRRQVPAYSGLGQSLPRGTVALTLLGMTGAGKSTAANVLTTGNWRKGLFDVGKDTSSTTHRVSTVYSQPCNVFVTDTPGLFDIRPNTPREELIESSNNHFNAVTHFLNSDGGLIIWAIQGSKVTSQIRSTARALNLCHPNWAEYTLVLNQAVNHGMLGEVETDHAAILQLGGEEETPTLADMFDDKCLQMFNESMKEEGVEFKHYVTFNLGMNQFGAERMLAKLADFAAKARPFEPGTVMSWQSILDGLKAAKEKEEEGIDKMFEEFLSRAEKRLQAYMKYAAENRELAEKNRELMSEESALSMLYILPWCFRDLCAKVGEVKAEKVKEEMNRKREELRAKKMEVVEAIEKEIAATKGFVADII